MTKSLKNELDKAIDECLLFSWLTVLFLSSIFISINHFYTRFYGNNFFPVEIFFTGILLILIYCGIKIVGTKFKWLEYCIRELTIYFFIISAIALFTYAIQFTTFPPIDEKLLNFESSLHINLIAIMSWTIAHPVIHRVLNYAYGTLAWQMVYIPILVIALKQYRYAREFFCLILISTILGFLFYYFFPTVAPASVIESTLFSGEQYATGIKFEELHRHMIPSTNEGGLIATPSFHVIWAWYLVYMLRFQPLLTIPVFLLNCLLACSCVMLGWHYVLDVVASVFIIVLTQCIYRKVVSPSKEITTKLSEFC